MTDLSTRKAALRKDVLARRAEAHRDGASPSALAARDHLLASRLVTAHMIVAGYRPIRSELDPTPLMEALFSAGHRVCVPVIEGHGQPLAFRDWHPAAEMMAGPFGAEIPVSGDWLEPEFLLVPLVGFDSAGNRLGYGGGFYDRTLERLRGRRPTRAVGFAYSVQEVDAVPCEPTDQVLDGIVTERGLMRPLTTQATL